MLERKLYDIDRADIQAVTGGSDDGFLYARGFIVAVGRDLYDAVASDPQMAVPDAECEEMYYFYAHLYRERFGEFPETGSGISRESCSNTSSRASSLRAPVQIAPCRIRATAGRPPRQSLRQHSWVPRVAHLVAGCRCIIRGSREGCRSRVRCATMPGWLRCRRPWGAQLRRSGWMRACPARK